MPRLDVNRFGEMEVFVRAVELGSFSAVAKACRMTPSAVSKLVARLESRLGARLINRSTRRLQLTPEGATFHERSVRLLADLAEAEQEAATAAVPRGRLRINANIPFSRHFLLPLIPRFLTQYPGITVDLVLSDQVVDLLEERADIAIRTGPLKNSRLVARKLGETGMKIVGAPSYFERHGMPVKPSDLERHNRLGFGFARAVDGWPLLDNGTCIMIPPSGNAQASDGDALHQLVLNGLGLARLATFQVEADIATGRLLPVLEAHNPGDINPIHAVFLGHGAHLPARVRAFIDFLADHIGFGQPPVGQ